MNKLVDLIQDLLVKIRHENERLIEEIKVYKELLYSIDINESDLDYIKELKKDVDKDPTFQTSNITSSINIFLGNLIKDKQK